MSPWRPQQYRFIGFLAKVTYNPESGSQRTYGTTKLNNTAESLTDRGGVAAFPRIHGIHSLTCIHAAPPLPGPFGRQRRKRKMSGEGAPTSCRRISGSLRRAHQNSSQAWRIAGFTSVVYAKVRERLRHRARFPCGRGRSSWAQHLVIGWNLRRPRKPIGHGYLCVVLRESQSGKMKLLKLTVARFEARKARLCYRAHAWKGKVQESKKALCDSTCTATRRRHLLWRRQEDYEVSLEFQRAKAAVDHDFRHGVAEREKSRPSAPSPTRKRLNTRSSGGGTVICPMNGTDRESLASRYHRQAYCVRRGSSTSIVRSKPETITSASS